MNVPTARLIYFSFSTIEELVYAQHELEKNLYPNILVQVFPNTLKLAFQTQNSEVYDKRISEAIINLGGTIN